MKIKHLNDTEICTELFSILYCCFNFNFFKYYYYKKIYLLKSVTK